MIANDKRPKLRTIEKYSPKYHLNAFEKTFAIKLGKSVISLLATRKTPRLEGSDWEEIFANCIGAKWVPSNVGLDDVVLEQMAWGAKTVKNQNPFQVASIRLISGRNSLSYSYGDADPFKMDLADLGTKILGIWNERIGSVRAKYAHLRTVVLIKGPDLTTLSVYEEETVMFSPEKYYWQWNEKKNLEGYENDTRIHRFTWQPHGSQFTIVSDVPANKLCIRLRKPPSIPEEKVLNAIKFDESWVEIVSTYKANGKTP